MLNKKKNRKKIIGLRRKFNHDKKSTTIKITSMDFVQFMIDMQLAIIRNFAGDNELLKKRFGCDLLVEELTTNTIEEMLGIVSLATQTTVDMTKIDQIAPQERLIIVPVMQAIHTISALLFDMPGANPGNTTVESFKEFINEELGRDDV